MYVLCVDGRRGSGGVGEDGITKVGDDDMEGDKGKFDVCAVCGWQRRLWRSW